MFCIVIIYLNYGSKSFDNKDHENRDDSNNQGNEFEGDILLLVSLFLALQHVLHKVLVESARHCVEAGRHSTVTINLHITNSTEV